MKKEYITIFLLVIAIILGVIFYFTDRPSQDKYTLKYSVGCDSDKIDASIYSLSAKTSLIGAFISFSDIPIDQTVKDKLTQLGVSIREDSLIFDYVLAEIPTESLCILAEEDFVKGIFIPKEN